MRVELDYDLYNNSWILSSSKPVPLMFQDLKNGVFIGRMCDILDSGLLIEFLDRRRYMLDRRSVLSPLYLLHAFRTRVFNDNRIVFSVLVSPTQHLSPGEEECNFIVNTLNKNGWSVSTQVMKNTNGFDIPVFVSDQKLSFKLSLQYAI